jgi:hypothetical protein
MSAFVSMEVVVETDPYDIIGDRRSKAIRKAIRAETVPTDSSEVDVEIFELRGPIAPECRLNSTAYRPS